MTLNEPLIMSPVHDSSPGAGSGKLVAAAGAHPDLQLSPSILLDYTLDLANIADDNYRNVKAFVSRVFEKTLQTSSKNSSGTAKYTLEIEPLKGGITNMLLKGTLTVSSRDVVHFLIRAYGKGTDSFINRDREFYTHLQLHELGLAPALYARFGNGLIYQYIPGRALHYTELSGDEVVRGIASKAAQWHVQIDPQSIQRKLQQQQQPTSSSCSSSANSNAPRDIWEIIKQWIDIVPEDIAGSSREEFHKELEWVKQTIGHTSPICTSHCDLLAGNVLVPENWVPKAGAVVDVNDKDTHNYIPSDLVTFIDYEYAIPAPRAFDLANHFAEWQGFDGRKDLIPEPKLSNPVLRSWMKHYYRAQKYYSNESDCSMPSEEDIDNLINEVIIWWGLPGFFWGIWAAIQATISDIDFDYKEFCEQRLSDYYQWKSDIYPTLKL